MGGFGSGRYAAGYSRGKRTVEQCISLDIKQFKGVLNKGKKFEHVNKEADNMSIVEAVVNPGEMNISLVFREKEDLIYLDKTACHFGGWRYWFHCPCCGERVGKLYHGSVGFACRECYNLNYTSQQFAKTDGHYHNLQAIRIAKRIDPNYEMDYTRPNFPSRPKYMKRVAYWRLSKRFYDQYNKGWSVFLTGASRLLNS